MEHETPAPAAPVKAPAPPVVVAAPEAVGGAPMGVDQVLSLQRTAGNRAVCRAIASGLIQRDDAQPAAAALTGVTVTPAKSSIPAETGVTITAKALPSAAGVTYTLAAGTATAASGTTIDGSSGKVTLDAAQPGGTLKAKATASTSWAEQEFALIEKPTAIASTSGSATGDYEGQFTHTFSAASGNAAGLQGENINERFDSLSATTPFGPFALQANAAGSPGWDLDGSGVMGGPDKVSIGSAGIDAQAFVASASNPTPVKTLPQGFSMAQHLHAKSFPSGALGASPFTTTDHVRTLAEENGKLVFKIKAGLKEVSMPYTGPAVYRNAKADNPSVQASGAQPAKPNTVQVSVSAEGANASPAYSIVGADLGCSVDAAGKVTIGSQAGTITVRAGEAKRYDEVKITITPAPAPPPGGAKPTDAGSDAAAAVPDAVTP